MKVLDLEEIVNDTANHFVDLVDRPVSVDHLETARFAVGNLQVSVAHSLIKLSGLKVHAVAFRFRVVTRFHPPDEIAAIWAAISQR